MLLLKSDQLGLFDTVVPVKASVDKNGVVRTAHMARRKKRADEPEAVQVAAALDEAPHRLHQRVDEAGFDSLSDQEALHLLLLRSMPDREAEAASRRLIAEHLTYQGAIGAPAASLASAGVPAQAVRDLKMIHDAAVRQTKEVIRKREMIGSWSALNQYLRTRLAHEPVEQFRVMFLDKKNQLIVDEKLGQGTIDHAPVYRREVVRRALELSASAMILIHNHPSGDPTPSAADIEVTRQIIDAAKVLDIVVHDHCVVGVNGIASFKSLGLMK